MCGLVTKTTSQGSRVYFPCALFFRDYDRMMEDIRAQGKYLSLI
nr:MAG TPA: protein of unknown function (DUF5064) [Caudoviricetes sp.]